MKEKIGIEKLIELLNEYDGDVLEYGFVDGDIRRKVKNFDNEKNTWKSVVWYTKQFGFIKWLVENDKIDREKCGFKNEGLSGNWYDSGIAFVQNYDNDTYKVSEFYSPYSQLLMLLSISDTPINDLISYLK